MEGGAWLQGGQGMFEGTLATLNVIVVVVLQLYAFAAYSCKTAHRIVHHLKG